VNILLGAYLLMSSGALGLPFLIKDYGPMADLANSLHILASLGFVCLLTFVTLVTLYTLNASINAYSVPALMLSMSVILVAYVHREDFRASVADARGYYYSVQYENESNNDIYVDGIGLLAVSRSSGTRGDYKLPSKIVWWDGTKYREARKSHKTFIVVPPPSLKKRANVTFTFIADNQWDMSIE
jgi:hypothetical protein